jgi:hypothetical protein
MRAALALPDPPLVLLDRLAMTGESRSVGPWPVGPALDRVRRFARGVPERTAIDHSLPTAAGGSPARDDDPVGVGDDRIAELDLDPDHRPNTGFLERRTRSDDPVEALMIGDGEATQLELGRPLGQLVRGRGAVEEREVRVAMKLGVGDHRRTFDDRTSVLLMTYDLPRKSRWRVARNSCLRPRNRTATSGVYCDMKRVTPSLLLTTLRTAFAVAVALLLILVLLPAMLAAQASGLR